MYPDPLLAQVLAAATYPADIPDAARWANGHVPSVLDMMAHDMPWTQELGDAVLAERAAVMDAVQRMRHQAWTYGYLRSNGSIVVNESDSLWQRRVVGSRVRAVGLGRDAFRVVQPHGDHQQGGMAANMGQPANLRPSVRRSTP